MKLKSKMAASVNVSGGVGPSGTTGQGIATFNAFPDEKKIRELTEQIRQRLSHAHQLKLTASQQQATPAASTQVAILSLHLSDNLLCYDSDLTS